MDIEKVSKELSKLNKNSQKQFFKNLYMLLSQLTVSSSLRGPYRLVLDSNIIMRLESYRNGKITEGLLAVFVFFLFLKKSNFQCDIVIRPTVFYEFIRQKKPDSIKEHWSEFKGLRDTIQEELSLPPFFDGIETFQGAQYYLDKIQHDVKLISEELRGYQERDWKFDFIRQGSGFTGVPLNGNWIEVPPFFAAQGLYKKLGLKYFNEEKASRFFIEHISKHLSECKENDQRVIEKYRSKGEYQLTKVLKLTDKGSLFGIADVDLLTLCGVGSQFDYQAHGRYYPASIGLSIDSNLSKALDFFSSMQVTSGEMLGGSSNLDDNYAKLEATEYDEKRIFEGEKRRKKLLMKQQEFFKEVFPVLYGALKDV